jgi:predicted nucleotidyltransferase
MLRSPRSAICEDCGPRLLSSLWEQGDWPSTSRCIGAGPTTSISRSRYLPASSRGGLELVPGWRRHSHKEHEFISPLSVKIDFIPGGLQDLARRELVWPNGFKMNLTGFRHVFARALPLEVEAGLQIHVAPLPVIVLLKMVAWLDRPAERERDLEDLAHVFDEFVEPQDEAFYGPEVIAQQISVEYVSAYLLGRELGLLVDAEERALVERFIGKLLADEATRSLMARLGPRGWNGNAEELAPRLELFLRGFRATQPAETASSYR